MPLKPVYELDTTTTIDENHNLLVYQDNRLKKLNAKDLFYSKDEINNNVVVPKGDIIKSLANLHVAVPSDATLYDLINYVDNIDLFEIGVRRLIHNGTDTTKFSGNPSATNNPKYVSMGVPQTSSILERCYKIGGLLTVIPNTNTTPNSNNDLIYANISKYNSMARNDFYGGDYASDRWKSGIYPWNSMEKVIDEHGNYFTKVPLYFIKEEYITDTGIDISASWPYIPERFIANNIFKYTFVCKTKLPGYRPADFFYDYKPYTMIEDSKGLYVYIHDLDCYTIPLYYAETDIRYSISETATDEGYTKILTRYHYFSCYEASIETVNGKTKITSKPGMLPTVSTTLNKFREYCKNTDSSYFVRDIRSYTDFFCTLFEIEFATTNSGSIVVGASSRGPFNNNNTAQIDATNTNTVRVNNKFVKGTYIGIGSSTGSTSVASDRLITSVEEVGTNSGIYDITFDGKPVTIKKGNVVWVTRHISGTTDASEFRSAFMGIWKGDSTATFKWNWIENPYTNIWKFIDGFHIKHEVDENGLLENCIYVTNNPALYSDKFTGYNKVNYIMPSEFLNISNKRTCGGDAYVSQLGYDPVYPWCQVASKVGASDSNGYADKYYETTQSSNDGTTRILMIGGSWIYGHASGLYQFCVRNVLTTQSYHFGAAIQKVGE